MRTHCHHKHSLISLIREYYLMILLCSLLTASVLTGAQLKWKAAWQDAQMEVVCVPKPRSAVLMKFTLWSIDLACGLIDAVFKNSLVWDMGELQGSRHSCRTHLSMFTEPRAFSQQQEKRPDKATQGSMSHTVTLYPPHTHGPARWENKLIFCMCLCTYIVFVVVIDCLVWSTTSVSVW